MKAVLLKNFGGIEELYFGEIDKPNPSKDEILVQVKAAALNRADILQRKGKYPPPKGASEILGLEIAGEIVGLGANAANWRKGDKIFGIIPGGGYAQYAVIHKDMAIAIPHNLSYTEATSIPEAFLTAYQALFLLAKTLPNEKVLVHAGGSGVGTACIQLLSHLGTTCIITASKSKHSKCYELGAQTCIDYHNEDFHEIIKTTIGKVNVIVDFIGASYFKQNIDCLDTDGRMVMLALMGGTNISELNIAKIVLNRINILGSTLRNRDLNYQIELKNSFWRDSKHLFEKNIYKAIIDKIYNWKDVASAHKRMEENKNFGKIVLEIS